MDKHNTEPVRYGSALSRGLIYPEPPFFRGDEPTPTVSHDIRVFLTHEIPKWLKTKDSKWALFGLSCGAAAYGWQSAGSAWWIFPSIILTLLSWATLAFAIALHFVVMHASFIRSCRIRHPHRDGSIFLSHLQAFCFSVPLLAIVALLNPV